MKTELPIAEFYPRIEQENGLLLLDVRNDQEYAAWRVETRHTPETVHLPYVVFVEDEEAGLGQVPAGREMVVVCAKGGASAWVAEILRARGIPAANLSGGMIAWGSHYVFRPVVVEEGLQLYQVDRVARGCLSYVLISQGRAAIIDPLRHVDRYREFLSATGTALKLVIDTHAHADHISSGPSLAKELGVPYYLHPYDAIHPFDLLPAKIPFEMLWDKQSFALGDLALEVVHVPGHTLGQINVVARTPEGSSFFFSGDNLFIQSLGRPDLGGQGRAWAPLVYDTIFGTVRERVPPDALVLPGHYSNFSEADERGVFARPLAKVWRENPSLQFTSKEDFVGNVLSHLPEMPPQYVQIKRVNAGLATPDEQEALELELGKNVCALND